MTASDHLSYEQFFAQRNPNVSFSDHPPMTLGLDRYYAPLDAHPQHMQRTGERATIEPHHVLIPNQPGVHRYGVDKYIEDPRHAPIALHRDPEFGNTYVIEGHHRLVAARLQGRSVEAEYWEHKKR